MMRKIEFQMRVLRKYGILPVFEGGIDSKIVRSPKEKETFSNWCERVLGRGSKEVHLYALYNPSGQIHMETLREADGGLNKIIRAHVRNVLQKKLKNSSGSSVVDEFEEFEDVELCDDSNRPEESDESNTEPWYLRLRKLKRPECLDSKDLLLLHHSDYDEFSEEYGCAARHIIVLNDVAQYAEELSVIFSSKGFVHSGQAAEELKIFAEDACQLDALKADLEVASESDKKFIQREHVELVMSYVGGLFDLIEILEGDLQDDIEMFNDAEQFIGGLMLDEPLDALRRCANLLYEL